MDGNKQINVIQTALESLKMTKIVRKPFLFIGPGFVIVARERVKSFANLGVTPIVMMPALRPVCYQAFLILWPFQLRLYSLAQPS